MKLSFPIILISAVLILNSCFKEDEKIQPHDPGDLETVSIALTNDYRYQVYFDLSSGQVISTNLKNEWDLAFECGPNGWHIRLNTSNFMVAARTGSNDLHAVTDTTGLTWKFDVSSGNPDSTAIGNWVSFSDPDSVKIYTGEVYVIDRGYDELGNLRGVRKIIFMEADEDQYVFRYADLDGTAENSFTIHKDHSVNNVFFSFDDGGKRLILEPPAYDWDILFTQYTTLLFTNAGEPYPYLLTGALINPVTVEVYRDTIYDFTAIDLDIAMGMDFSKMADKIGYDWKDVIGDVTSGNVSYVIIPGINYIIRDWQGFYYKMRFISFYSNSGEKGYPTFEYQKL